MAKSVGAVVSTTCSSRNVQFVTDLGADRVIDYTTENWWEVLAGEDYDVVYDAVGSADHYDKAKKILKPKGVFVTIAMAADVKVSVSTVLSVGADILGKKIAQVFGDVEYHFVMKKNKTEQLEKLAKLVEDGSVRPVVASVYGLDQIADAFKESMGGRVRGKIAIAVKPELETSSSTSTSTSTSSSSSQPSEVALHQDEDRQEAIVPPSESQEAEEPEAKQE